MSRKNNKPQFLVNLHGVRDFAWTDEAIHHSSISEIREHYETFKSLRRAIYKMIPPRWRYHQYLEFSRIAPSGSAHLELLEAMDWFPCQILEFYDWLSAYESKIRNHIQHLRIVGSYERRAAAKKRRGIPRHIDKWAPKSRRSTNKGKPKMVSDRNYDRLYRKWEREIIREVKAGTTTCLFHEYFELSPEVERWALKTIKEGRKHWHKMRNRELEGEKSLALRKKESSEQ